MANRYWVGGNANWDATAGAKWATSSGGTGGEAVPTAADDVFLDNGTGTGNVTIAANVVCRSLNCTGYVGILTYDTNSRTMTIGDATAGASNIALKLVAGMTYTALGQGNTINFATSNSTQQTVDTAGLITGNLSFGSANNNANLLLASTLNGIATTASITHGRGTFNTGNNTINYGSWNGSSSNTRSIILGTSTINLSGVAAANIWEYTTVTNLTFSGASSTIVFTGVATNTRTFAGGGQAYGTLQYTVAFSPGILVITGANTFTTLNVGSGRTLTLPSAVTTTVTNFTVNGTNNGYIYLPGLTGNYFSAPDIANYTGSGIMRMIVRVGLDDWTPSNNPVLIGHWTTAAGSRGWALTGRTTGELSFTLSSTGAGTTVSQLSSAPSLVDGTVYWLGVEYDTATGALAFYKAADQSSMPTIWSSWTQISNHTVTAATPFNSDQPLTMGAFGDGTSSAKGKFYRGIFYVDTNTLEFDTNLATKTFGDNTLTDTSSNAATVTINGALAQSGDGRLMLNSSSAGSAATLSKSSGEVSVNYHKMQDSAATGGAAFYAGGNSVDVSGNSGWVFTGPPASATPQMMMMGVGS